MFKHKKLTVLAVTAMLLAACGTSETGETIRLQVWGPAKEGEREIYTELATRFQAAHPEITFKMGYGDVGEADAATQALADVDTAADVFMFADDQLANLVGKGVLAPLSTTYANMVKARDLGSAVDSATYGTGEAEKLYAFPLTADNGYFLIYNNEFFTETDVLTLEGMMAKTSANHQFVMDLGNGYYAMSPVMMTGEISYDPTARVHATTYNNAASADALEGFIDLLRPRLDTGFKSDNVDNIIADMGDDRGNKVVAVVTGVWNVDNIEEVLGEKMSATKLPTFKSKANATVQMGAFAGSKLVGVKSSTSNLPWALAFAEFVTNEASQAYRFAEIGKGPSNIAVSNSDEVQANAGLAALGEQSEFAIPQGKSVGGTFWDPAAAVGNFVFNGPASEDAPQTAQEQLDAFVAAVTAAPVTA